MIFTLSVLAFAGVLLVGMLVLLEVGRRIGERRLQHDAEGARAGVGVIEGSVFGLLGLLLAFTFSGAASRFDEPARCSLATVWRDGGPATGSTW